MTVGDVDNEVRAAGCGWYQPSQALVLTERATPDYCNTFQCRALVDGATRSGASAEDVGAAALALVNGDKAPMRAILAP